MQQTQVWGALTALADIFSAACDPKQATYQIEKAMSIATTVEIRCTLKFRLATVAIPQIVASFQDIATSRALYRFHIAKTLAKDNDACSSIAGLDPSLSLSNGAFGYYLVYNSFDDDMLERVQLVERYRSNFAILRSKGQALAAGSAAAGTPNFEMKRALRVGFASSHFRDHSVGSSHRRSS